jgi:hypothetical protein
MSNKITIKVGTASRTVQCPASWNDLDVRTMALFYETMFSNLGDENSAAAFTSVKLISMTQALLKVDMAFMAKWEAHCMKEDPQYGNLVFYTELSKVIEAALGGLLERKEDENGAVLWSVKFNLTNNPYPELSHTPKVKGSKKPAKSTWYFAPKNELSNITIYEMAYSFQLYENYVLTGNMEHVHMLIGTLYRPSRPFTKQEEDSAWFGDRRQPLHRYEAKIEERAKLAEQLPTLAKRLIVFWFASCRDTIIKQWPTVFKRSGGKEGGSGGGWGDLLLSLAETGVFGALDQTADQHYANALRLLTMREDQAKQAEQKALKAKLKK